MSVPTLTELKAPTPLLSRPRVVLVTLGVIAVATAVPYLLEGVLTILVNAVYPNPAAPAFGETFSALTPATESIAPAALGGIFWFALVRLGRHGPRRVALETLGLGALLFSLTLVAVGAVTYYADWVTTPALARATGGPRVVVTAIAHVPWVLLVLAALALLYGGLALGFALLLASWNTVRSARAFGRGGRSFALVYGVASLVMLSAAVLNPLFFSLATSPALTNGTDTPSALADVFLFGAQFVLPSAILAVAGAAGAMRAVRRAA
jgi:hypothetical protein